MTNNKFRRRTVISIILVVLLCIASWVALLPMSAAKATSIKPLDPVIIGRPVPPSEPDTYTDISSDFEGVDFDFSDYEFSLNDNLGKLEVIQLAEGSDGSVYVYVKEYNVLATSIRVSTAINDNFKPEDYPLEFIGRTQTVSKYKISGITVKSDLLRYYDIVCIFRKFDSKYGDKQPSDDNTVSEVVYEVSQLWTASTVNGAVSYSMTTLETIKIVDKHCGFLRYKDGGHVSWDSIMLNAYTDSHYVAFSTDKDIQQLYEADIEFYSVHYWIGGVGVGDDPERWEDQAKAEDPVFHSITLTSEDSEVSNPANGWHGQKHVWKRIESISEFIDKEQDKLKDETKTALRNDKWVLRFYETSYHNADSFTKVSWWDKVEKVSILRLKFETNGKVYNLGVVDNKQSGDLNPDNNWFPEPTFWDKIVAWAKSVISKILGLSISSIPDWAAYIFLIVLAFIAIVLLIVLIPFLPGLLSAIVNLLVLLFKGLWWLISAPVRLIVSLIKKDE